MGSVDYATGDVPTPLMSPISGELSPAEPPDTPQDLDQPNPQAHEVPAEPTPVLSSPHEPSPDEPRALPNPGSLDSDHLLSVTHSRHTAPADDHRTVPISDVRSEELDFDVAARRIDEIAQVAQTVYLLSVLTTLSTQDIAFGNPKLKGKRIIELWKLCGDHHTVPTPYKLESVVKRGEHPQRISKVTEIWKGVYRDEVVALKVLRVPQDNPHAQRTRRVSMSPVPQERVVTVLTVA